MGEVVSLPFLGSQLLEIHFGHILIIHVEIGDNIYIYQ